MVLDKVIGWRARRKASEYANDRAKETESRVEGARHRRRESSRKRQRGRKRHRLKASRRKLKKRLTGKIAEILTLCRD